MTEKHSEEFARLVLESWGLQVTRLPAGPARTADFLAADESHRFIVEVTEKAPTPSFEVLKAESETSGFASMSRALEPWNLLDAKIRGKHKQLTQTHRPQESLTTLWYYAPRGGSFSHRSARANASRCRLSD